MKNSFNLKRGGAIALAITLFAACTSAFALDFVQGIYVDGSANTVAVGGTNVTRSAALPLTTNTFNLSMVSLFQGNTNQYPAQPLVNSSGWNHRLLCLGGYVWSSGADTTVEMINFYGSLSPSTNFVQIGSIAVTKAGATPVSWYTNLDTYAYPYIVLGSFNNTNGTATTTNLFLSPVGKTGF